MWHKLFKSKSAKLSSSSTTLSNASTSEESSLMNNCSSTNNNYTENNHKSSNNNNNKSNKFTNALKRVSLKRAHSASSNSHSKKLQKHQNEISNNNEMPDFRDNYHEFSMSNAINVPVRESDERHLTSFSTFRVGSAGKNVTLIIKT